jgi:cell shape-determining protein MreD
MKFKLFFLKNIYYLINIMLFWAVISLSSQQIAVGIITEIWPAMELILLFYISVNRRLDYVTCLLAGLVCDQLQSVTLGINAILFISGEYMVRIANSYFNSCKDYLINLLIFYAYALLLIVAKSILVTATSASTLDMLTSLFYFLTTIFSYPLIAQILTWYFQRVSLVAH